jgi:peptide/nickel transport system substrate-binding protein
MRRVPAIVASLCAMLVPAAPALADAPSRDLRVATTTKIATLNPLIGQLASEYRVWALNFDVLVAFDARTMKPDRRHSLAAGWTVSRDRLTWTYRLRRNLFWSDGEPLTAEDVAWTMNFVDRRVAPSETAPVKRWEARGRLTVVAHLTSPSVQMRSLWIYILPKHIWRAADTDRWRHFRVPLPLVGSGPYTVTRWRPDGTTVLTRNPYFARRRAMTGPERVLMTYYRSGHRAATDLEQNRLDVLPSDTLEVPDAQRLQRVAGVHVYRSPPLGLEYWVFNLSPNVSSRVHRSVVQSRAIRTALAWAIDRSRLVEAALRGYGSPGNTQVPRSYGRFSLDLSDDPTLGYRFDPPRARRILDQAGWRPGPGGIRRKSGARAAFELAYSSSPGERRAATLIRTWARAVGIEIDLRAASTDELLDLELHRGDRGTRRPDFDSELWSIGGDPTPEFLLSLFTRAQIGSWNDSGFVDRTYEKLYRQEIAAADEPARISAIRMLQRIATKYLPYIELYEADDIGAVNTRTWSNWTTQPSPQGQPLTEYGYDTIIALRPRGRATPGYPGVPLALAALAALAAVALGSSLVARRRERREPFEIADAPA